MSKELKKNAVFEIILVAPEARGLNDGLTEVSNFLSCKFVQRCINLFVRLDVLKAEHKINLFLI